MVVTKFVLIFWIQGFNVAGPTVIDGFDYPEECQKAYQQILAKASEKTQGGVVPVSWGACIQNGGN